MRELIERKMASRKVSREMLKALKPQLAKVRKAGAPYGLSSDTTDAELAADVWDTARSAGWKEDEVIASPYDAVRDVLAIWR